MQEVHDSLRRLEDAVYTINGRTEAMNAKLDEQNKKIDGLAEKYDERIDGPSGIQIMVDRNTESIRSLTWKWKATFTAIITVIVTWVWSKIAH